MESGAVTFELDPVLNNGLDPEFTVAGIPLLPGGKVLVTDDGTTTKAAQIEVVSPLMIIADFSRQCTTTSCQTGGEAKEYEGDSYKTVELTSASASVSLADGSKETPPVLMKSSDNVKYTLIILEPPLGDYTITLQARDAAGNVAKVAGTPAPSDLTNSFSLISPKPVEIALAPGWNLVSLPFHPPNPAINAIVPPDHSINFVMAYDIAMQVWHASRRDADTGLLEGDVGAMTADTAYFVHTDTFEPLSLFLPSGARLGTVLPIPASLPLTLGWNLVPVVSRALPPPPGVEADLYFKSVKWLEAQSYQPLTKSWESIVPAQVIKELTSTDPDFLDPCGFIHKAPGSGTKKIMAQLCIGQGYWVRVSEAGDLAP